MNFENTLKIEGEFGRQSAAVGVLRANFAEQRVVVNKQCCVFHNIDNIRTTTIIIIIIIVIGAVEFVEANRSVDVARTAHRRRTPWYRFGSFVAVFCDEKRAVYAVVVSIHLSLLCFVVVVVVV
jgi:hypothetical protein